jgi:isoleucyl-tRNA synthetase
VARLLAPYTPFVAEELHQHLVRPARPDAPASVHWTDYPQVDRAVIDEELERAMALAERVVVLGRAARNAASLRVRQPLQRIAVAGLSDREQRALLSLTEIIQEELNVKELTLARDRAEFLTVVVKPNFPVLGKKAGPAMKELAAAIEKAPPGAVQSAIASGGWEVEAAGQRFKLTAEDVIVQESSKAPWSAQADGAVTVAVDTALNDALRDEGLVRELAHRVQALRKSAEFEVTDRIRLYGELSPGLKRAFERHAESFKEEVLAVELVPGATGGEAAESWTFDGEQARVGIERIGKGG